jgi:hypothetical protein
VGRSDSDDGEYSEVLTGKAAWWFVRRVVG